MRYLILALLLLAAAFLIGQMERQTIAYTPVMRVRSSDGYYVTIVQRQLSTRAQCTGLLEHFEQALRRNCPTCAVEASDCAGSLQGLERSLAADEHLPIFTISAEPMRLGLLGPPRNVQAECEAIAAYLVRSGVKSASCVSPSAALAPVVVSN
jgi:hypothetical protein